ncbi:hypothetical protein MCACP_22880 [Neomoorella carbonis]
MRILLSGDTGLIGRALKTAAGTGARRTAAGEVRTLMCAWRMKLGWSTLYSAHSARRNSLAWVGVNFGLPGWAVYTLVYLAAGVLLLHWSARLLLPGGKRRQITMDV